MTRIVWGWVVGLMLLSRPVIAQAGPSLGVELGYSRADFTGADASGVKRRDGAIAGAWFRLPLAAVIAVQPGIGIASRGGAAAVPSPLGTLRLEVDLVYLDLPLLLRATLPGLAGTRFVLLGGGAPSLRIGCNVEVKQTGVPPVRQSCSATGASFREWDVALVAGAGIAIPVERSELSIQAKLVRGLRSVSEDSEIRNRTYSISVSVPF
jgi:hypothetical protein